MEKPIEEKTNKDLQEELVTLGLPQEEASKINNKATLISMVNALKTKDAQIKEAQESAKTVDIADVPSEVRPGENMRVEKKWKSKAHKQWDLWDNSAKVRTMVPLNGREKPGVIRWELNKALGREVPVHVSGAIQTVIENGAQYVVPKGVMIDVPEPVAKLIEKKFYEIARAGEAIKADRLDPETGKPVLDRL